MRKYPLHYMNEDDFEQLTISICSKILGEGVKPFAKGSDGGRDGRFTGKANCFPSEQQSWDGKFVIEAKHTSKENASCSDYEFKKRLKNEVAPAIKRNLEKYFFQYESKDIFLPSKFLPDVEFLKYHNEQRKELHQILGKRMRLSASM